MATAEQDDWQRLAGYRDSDNLEAYDSMAAITEYEIVDSYLWEEGWGHHDGWAIVKTLDGKYHYGASGGCSCGASGTYAGPFDTEEEVRRYVAR